MGKAELEAAERHLKEVIGLSESPQVIECARQRVALASGDDAAKPLSQSPKKKRKR